MKRRILAAIALLAATPALAIDWDFILINNRGKDIAAAELAPAGSDHWLTATDALGDNKR